MLEPIEIAPPNCDEPISKFAPVVITSNEFDFTFPFAVIKPVDVSGPALVVVIPDDPSVIAVAVDVPNDNVPADATVSDGDVKAEPFITPVEEIEPVLDPFLNNVPIRFPDDAVIFPLVSVIDVEKVGEVKGAYVVDASADVKYEDNEAIVAYVVDASADVKYEDKALLIKAVVDNLVDESPAVGVGAIGDVINSFVPFNVV